MNRIWQELHWIDSAMGFWFWVGVFPYILQYLTVEIMTG